MTNKILQQSTLLCVAAHIGGLYYYTQTPLYYKIHLFIGLTLSLANHTYTSRLAQLLDRAYMTASIPATLLIAPTLFLQLGVVASVALYIYGKLAQATYIHCAAHYTLTVVHLGILREF